MQDRVEVLSYAYEHLYSTDWRIAISDVFVGRAEVLEEHEDRFIGMVNGLMPMPKVVRFKGGITASKLRSKMQEPARFSKDVLFARDGGRCQYCDRELARGISTIDHIMPRSRGGDTSWENCVTCCPTCNVKKGNRTPTEAGMCLLSLPAKPRPQHIRTVKK